MNAVSIRGDWVGQVIDGRFPLIEWLGGSGTSGVFLTELDGPASRKAAIKLIPASVQVEDRFAGWSEAASLAHPHLLRIFGFGRAEIGKANLIYIVTEVAEEVLAQIIPDRPLSPDETREMLVPILDALGYLHANAFVHGHLNPSNILVVENEIKISSDGLLPAGKPAPELLTNDMHIAPETSTSPVAASADAWSLGVTLVEALTQQPPIWDAADDADPVLPASVPNPFAEIARACLQLDPARRCSLSEIRAMLEGKPKPAAASLPPHPPHHPHRIAEKIVPAKIPFVPLIVGFVLLVAIIVAFQLRSHETHTPPAQTEMTQPSPAAEPDPQAALPKTEPIGRVATATTSSGGDVVNRVIPDVPRSASNTISGNVGVVVRVDVDATGAVTNAELVSHGPSAYFARLAVESARNWKFKPPQHDGRAVPSAWMLHYQFRRDGISVSPKQSDPR